MNYPRDVVGEFATMRAVADGASLARFGDGELKIIYGSSYVRQTGGIKIATELFNVLNHPAPGCLVGIPTLDPAGPKYTNWLRHKERFAQVIQRDGPWHSAFVTRPDSAPWIECESYRDLVLSCWRGKRVAAVCESTSKMLPVLRRTAKSVAHVECPSHQAYGVIADLRAAIKRTGADLAVLCCGVTATALANRLAGRGLQAIDFGSAGGMMARLMDGERASVAVPA